MAGRRRGRTRALGSEVHGNDQGGTAELEGRDRAGAGRHEGPRSSIGQQPGEAFWSSWWGAHNAAQVCVSHIAGKYGGLNLICFNVEVDL